MGNAPRDWLSMQHGGPLVKGLEEMGGRGLRRHGSGGKGGESCEKLRQQGMEGGKGETEMQ